MRYLFTQKGYYQKSKRRQSAGKDGKQKQVLFNVDGNIN